VGEIRTAHRGELEMLREIERDAGGAFASIGMPEIAAHEPPSVAELSSFVAIGRAWVAVNELDRPVAYLLSAVIDGCAHIEQVSVAPEYARRMLGAALIDRLAVDAADENRPALTLTTFRDVPWNAPYYARLGFVALQPTEYGPELRALVERENRTIPSAAPRIAMRRPTRRSADEQGRYVRVIRGRGD
jgi:GNAT superfamily N-acetyltransferase